MSLSGINEAWLHSHRGLDCAIATRSPVLGDSLLMRLNSWLLYLPYMGEAKSCAILATQRLREVSFPSIPASGHLSAIPLVTLQVTM